MNLLEQYIVEVHEVAPYTEDWTKEFTGKTFVLVDVTSTCYGIKKRKKEIFSSDDWERFKEQGYWMA